MNSPVVDVTMETAQNLLIDESLKRPVLVDFWADWCGPCKNLAPILEKIAEEYAGEFLLAKVDTDAEQMLAAQFGVRSLPTVMLIKDGQPVDGFAGLKSEQEVRDFLSEYLPKPWEKNLGNAHALMDEGDYAGALELLRPAYAESGAQADIAKALAKCLIQSRRLSEAEEVLNAIKLADQDGQFAALKSELELAEQAQKTPELAALEERRREDPQNLDVAFQLAVQYGEHEYREEALEVLYGIIQKDMNFRDGEAKKIYLDVLAVLGKSDPVAIQYQRKLFTLLY